MPEYEVKGVCEIEVSWSSDTDQIIEVYHREHDAHRETDIDAIRSGEAVFEVPFTAKVYADNSNEAACKAIQDLNNENKWDSTVYIDGEENLISMYIESISCKVESVKRI